MILYGCAHSLQKFNLLHNCVINIIYCATQYIGALEMSSAPELHQIDHIEGNGKVVKVIERVATKWEKVATRLHFDYHVIDCIKKDNQYYDQTVSCCREMFGKWLGGKGRKPVNWETLITALKEADFSELASELQNIICGTRVEP